MMDATTRLKAIECVVCERKGLREGHFRKGLHMQMGETYRICDECEGTANEMDLRPTAKSTKEFMHGYLDMLLDPNVSQEDRSRADFDFLEALDDIYPPHDSEGANGRTVEED